MTETCGSGCEYIRRFYGVPAKLGMHVLVNGHLGVIKSATHNLGIQLVGQKGVGWYHPTANIIYYDERGRVLFDSAEGERPKQEDSLCRAMKALKFYALGKHCEVIGISGSESGVQIHKILDRGLIAVAALDAILGTDNVAEFLAKDLDALT